MKEFERLLVVISADSLEGGNQNSEALVRAREIADRVGCEIQLYSICYDASLSPSMFIAPELIDNERQRKVDARYEALNKTAKSLRARGYVVSCEANWSYPPADAIAAKALADGSDLVIKQPGDHSYHAGLFSNTDWDLIRTCPIPCLFTRNSDAEGGAHSVLACIDPTRDIDGDQPEGPLDWAVYETAQRLSDIFSAPIDVVNAFEIPASIRQQFVSYAPILPSLTGSATPADAAFRHEDHAGRHGRALQAFADHFKYRAEDIIVRHGNPAQVICQVAEEQSSSMIVMGALERGRLERALLSVNAEPVLADAPCDVLFVKPADHSVSLDDLKTPLIRRRTPGHARKMLDPVDVDVEQAMTDPTTVFTDPMFINRRPDISLKDKRRILESWELDRIRLQESAYEGELVSKSEDTGEVASLRSVKNAERLLAGSPL